MNIIWYVLRNFYVLGLLPVVPLFFIMATQVKKNVETSIPVLVGCAAYFILGYVWLKLVPDYLRARLLARVERHKEKGFTPQWEVISILYNRYLGFDPTSRKALYVDVNDGTETLVDFDNLQAWELEVDSKGSALLKLLTRITALPVIKIGIDRRKADEWKAYLAVIFG